MTDFLIVGTIHEERAQAKISSSALLDLATRYRPDAVMCECATDEWELHRDNLFDPQSGSLEACFFSRYRSLSGQEPIPIDMAGKSTKHYDQAYWSQERAVWSRLEELAAAHPILQEHSRTWDFIEEVGLNCGYNLINSPFFDAMVLHAYGLMDELLPAIIEKECPEFSGFWKASIALRHRRDSEIFANMIAQSRGHQKVLVVIGAGHSPVLRRQLAPLVEAKEFTITSLWDLPVDQEAGPGGRPG